MKHKIIKFVLLILGVLFSHFQLLADEVKKEMAKIVAENFFNQTLILNQLSPIGEELVLLLPKKSSGPVNSEKELFYVFNAENNRGFVIVSAEDQTEPILGFALEGNFTGENFPPAFSKWMEEYKKQILFIRRNNLRADLDTQNKWKELMGLSFKYSGSLKSVAPLVSTKWDQMPFFNALCPYDNFYNDRTVTGCVATAMAQILKYHNHPENGKGFSSYNHNNYGTLSANYGATSYGWNQMPNVVGSQNSAVANLMYHCGVSIEMDYGTVHTGGSSTRSIDVVATALKEYFDYDNNVRFIYSGDYSDSEWKQILRNELDNARPMEYAGTGNGSGHAFVCDGYQQNDFFHFNWGWSGQYDNYFYLTSLIPDGTSTGGGGGDYTYNQMAVVGIQPKSSQDNSDPGLYSEIAINPNPIAQGFPVDVYVEIANYGNVDFTGDLCAAMFNSDNEFISFIETKQGRLETGFYYQITFHNDSITAYPGNYFIGIYYRSGGENWAILPGHNYTNYAEIQIDGEQNDIGLLEDIIIDPDPVVSGEKFDIWFDVGNFGQVVFNGSMSADLYSSEGDYIAELDIKENMSLDPGYHYTAGVSLHSGGEDLDPGSYLLAIWSLPDNGEWTLIKGHDHENPITIQIIEPPPIEDAYEDNDFDDRAYTIPVNYYRNKATIKTHLSNLHDAFDVDYYKVELGEGYDYILSPRVNDSYNSGDGENYTCDVNFAWTGGSIWYGYYDDVIWYDIEVIDGGTIYFYVQSYFFGNSGTYTLEVDVSRSLNTGIEKIAKNDLQLKVFPNPVSDLLRIEFDDKSQAINRIEIYNSLGEEVIKESLSGESYETTINLSHLRKGIYYLIVYTWDGYYNKKVVVN